MTTKNYWTSLNTVNAEEWDNMANLCLDETQSINRMFLKVFNRVSMLLEFEYKPDSKVFAWVL